MLVKLNSFALRYLKGILARPGLVPAAQILIELHHGKARVCRRAL